MFSVFTLLRRFLFIYQQEGYNSSKLLAFAYSKAIFENPEKRQQLDWTLKAKVYYTGTLIIFFVLLISVLFQLWWSHILPIFLILSLCSYGILLILLPCMLVTLNVAFIPLDTFLKQKRIQETKKKLKRHKSYLTTIGITGSFGKTSVKEILETVLSEKFSVITTKENKNTPLGIAEMVDEISVTHQIFLVEMGAFVRGDIRELCDLTQPQYGVLTGINEQHLERQGSIENIIKTKNELSESLPQSGKIWVNERNERARTSVKNYAKCPVVFYGNSSIKNIEYAETGEQKITFNSGVVVKSQILAEYFPSLADLAFQVGKEFGMTDEEIIKGLEKVKAADHRLSPNYNKAADILIIDDAYNGNPDGALAAMKTLSRFKKKRKIYLTPGLVELADKSSEIHQWLGKNLAFHTDEVWLIRKSVTDDIIEGLKKSHFDMSKVRVFERDVDAHAACRTDLKAGDVLLIQNDWTDNYV